MARESLLRLNRVSVWIVSKPDPSSVVSVRVGADDDISDTERAADRLEKKPEGIMGGDVSIVKMGSVVDVADWAKTMLGKIYGAVKNTVLKRAVSRISFKQGSVGRAAKA